MVIPALTPLQFIGYFWTTVVLVVVWMVLDGIAKSFGWASTLMVVLCIGMYLLLCGVGIYTVYVIGSLILGAMM